MSAAAPRVLVIGYGNPGRQDDGLGPAAAASVAALGWPGVDVLDNYQLVIEDAIAVAGHDLVWFVDAARVGPAPCAVQPLAPRVDARFTSHRLAPDALLAMAAQFCGGAPEAYLLGIRGYRFAFREGLSPRAAANLHAGVALLRARIGAALAVAGEARPLGAAR
jgi:hydrogenase maturation protease